MDVLPLRIYADDTEDRSRFLPYGLHPAKMNIALTLDLVRRYTRKGDTILDPFLGIGGTGLALLEGRNVVGVELEPHHYDNACKNLEYLEGIARDLGHDPSWAAINGDSRNVTFRGVDTALSSPAFGEMNAEHAGGNVTQRPAKDGKGFDGGKEFFTYDRNAALGSPPYADALNESPAAAAKQRERVAAKIASGAKHPEGTKWGRRGSWGGGAAHRVPQGYMGMGSPPYGDELSRNRSEEAYAKNHPELSREYGRTDPARSADGYGKDKAQIGNLKLKDGSYQAACTAVYKAVYGTLAPGGILVLVTGDYVRDQKVVDLAGLTIEMCESVGWLPVERWRTRKKRVSFWRQYWAKKGAPEIDYEDVLVFCKDHQGYPFTELPPTGVQDDPEIVSLF